MFAMNSRFRDHYTKTGLLCTEAGKSKRAQQKLQGQRVSRTERLSTQRNLKGLSGDSDTHKTVVDARKLKLLKWKEMKVNLKKWKEGKEASEKPIFKCGIVHHKDGSPYLNDISNLNYSGHAKKMPSKAAKCEGQTFAQKSCTLKNLETDNKVQMSAPTNFLIKPPEFRSGAVILI